MKVSVITAVAALALVSCSDHSSDDDIQTQPERVLIGGPLPNQNQTDCRVYEERGPTPEPGVNCTLPSRLLEFIAGSAANFHVLLVDLALDPEMYGAEPEFLVCTLPGGGSIASSLVPTARFEVLDDFGHPMPDVKRVVFKNPCRAVHPICGLAGVEEAYVTAGANLVFFGRNCCLDLWMPGSAAPFRIYPVEGDQVYDWDGEPIPLADVDAAIRKALSPPPSPDKIIYDMDCEKMGDLTIETYENQAAYYRATAP